MTDEQVQILTLANGEKYILYAEPNIYLTKFDAGRFGWVLPYWSEYCASKGEPDGSTPDTPLNGTIENHFIENLREYSSRYENGNEVALLDALHLCRNENFGPPEWVVAGLEGFVVSAITSGKAGKVGRSNSPLARARQTMKLVKQREVIDQIRLAQKLTKDSENKDVFMFMALPNEVKSYFELNGQQCLGTNLEDAVELAELCLRGTPFQATFSTLMRLAKSQFDSTYEISEPSVRSALGISGLDEHPMPFSGYSVLSFEGCEASSEEETVKENSGFWVTVRLSKI